MRNQATGISTANPVMRLGHKLSVQNFNFDRSETNLAVSTDKNFSSLQSLTQSKFERRNKLVH